MQDSVIERCARAIDQYRSDLRRGNDALLAQNGLWPDRSKGPTDKQIVYIVLQALREPSEAMIAAGNKFYENWWTIVPPDGIFRGMIDAALSERSQSLTTINEGDA